MTRISTRLTLLACVGALLTCLGVLQLAPPADAKRDKRPTVVVGTDYDPGYPPFEFVDPKSGRVVGFDIDMAEAIARKAGFKVEFRNDVFEALLVPGLQPPAEYDMVAAALTITADREEYVDFSEPYFDGGLYTPWPGELIGFAFPTGSALRERVNLGLQQIKDNGTYDQIFKKWFGTEPPS